MARNDSSIIAEPNSVNRKNLIGAARSFAVRTAPHPDHEEHRQQHDLEEDEEEDEVLGATNVPFIPTSSSRMSARNALTLCGSKWFQGSLTITVTSIVGTSSGSEMPSMPR